MAPVEFSASISKEGIALLRAEREAFYRALGDEGRYTLTIDRIGRRKISGTIRRR
jgi:hypothetical protein